MPKTHLNSNHEQTLAQASEAEKFLSQIYGVKLNLDIKNFCSLEHNVKNLGTVLCQQNKNQDLDISIFLDRDFFSASLKADHYSVLFEEVSHFYALSSSYLIGKSVTQIELEAQSEIDRLLCTLSLDTKLAEMVAAELNQKLYYKPYKNDPTRETSRNLIKSFLRNLSSTNPLKWKQRDFQKLSSFFYADFSQKCSLARYY